MSTSQVWMLKRYGRFVPSSVETGGSPWKVFEANGNKPEIILRIMESGYMLLMQGKECLDTVPLLCNSDILKVHQKSDNLMFRLTVKGEGRMLRMQFYGSSKTEAIKLCLSAVEKLVEYIPVTLENTLQPPQNSPAEGSAPVIQQSQRGTAEGGEPEGSVSIKHLTQHYLGEASVTLPEVYRHGLLSHGDLAPILRICLLDPTFQAFVEKVEGELSKLGKD